MTPTMASWGTYVRRVSLAVIVAVGAWLLWPRAGGEFVTGMPEHRDNGADARFVIKFVPGQQYMPGTTPFGLGEPLKGMAEVVRDFEARFPDTRVELITVPGVREYLVTQLSSGNAPDILMVNVEDVWVDVQKGWYVPLDPYLEAPNPFVDAIFPAPHNAT
ncbi:MAG TPA: extracellular solute-binding protein, partial [Candidatus Hydrogenedentes bacterium]|nr:extracellular solute-binding protein [Candidatus Hydrogenedentota bacterium]